MMYRLVVSTKIEQGEGINWKSIPIEIKDACDIGSTIENPRLEKILCTRQKVLDVLKDSREWGSSTTKSTKTTKQKSLLRWWRGWK